MELVVKEAEKFSGTEKQTLSRQEKLRVYKYVQLVDKKCRIKNWKTIKTNTICLKSKRILCV